MSPRAVSACHIRRVVAGGVVLRRVVSPVVRTLGLFSGSRRSIVDGGCVDWWAALTRATRVMAHPGSRAAVGDEHAGQTWSQARTEPHFRRLNRIFEPHRVRRRRSLSWSGWIRMRRPLSWKSCTWPAARGRSIRCSRRPHTRNQEPYGHSAEPIHTVETSHPLLPRLETSRAYAESVLTTARSAGRPSPNRQVDVNREPTLGTRERSRRSNPLLRSPNAPVDRTLPAQRRGRTA